MKFKSQCLFETIAVADDFLDDTSSQSSSHSGSYSNVNYISGDDHKFDMPTTKRDQKPPMRTQNSTRFCPQDNSSSYIGQAIAKDAYKHCKLLLESQHGASSPKNKRVVDNRRLTRNRSLVDIRSQLLHRSLVEEVNKRRLFKTAGSVENVGFQAPPEDSKRMAQRNSCRRK